MNAEARQASLVIDSVAKAVANWTVDKHAEQNPQLPNCYGSAWRADWIGHTLSQIHLLAQAVALRSTDLFTNSMRWTFESFKSRGVDEADLLQNTRCMREVLAEELPPAVGQLAMASVDAALKALETPIHEIESNGAQDTTQQQLVLKYLEAILEGDRSAAEATVLATIDQGLTIPQIYENILVPAQVRLGLMWHRGEISIADEHFGSATTQAVMSQLRPQFKRAATNGRIVVCTSTPGDLHEIGLRMVADLFEIDGWIVVYIGANTPTSDVVELLQRRRADLLVLSASTALTLRDAGELIQQVRETSGVAGARILIGGPPFKMVTDLWRALGADGCTSSATEAVDLGNKLVAS